MGKGSSRGLLAEWFAQWRQPLRQFLSGYRALPAADLDDVAQEVFLRLLRFDRSELVDHPRAYLFKIASNVAAEWSIRARVARPHQAEWLDELATDDTPEGRAEQESAQQEVRRALMTLSPRHREVLKLHFTEGLSYAQIAEHLGATPRTVRRLMEQSYEKMRLELSPELLGVMTDGRE